MELTGGQTYFLFLCVTVIAVALIHNICRIIRVHRMTSPCSELVKLKEEVRILRLAIKKGVVNARRSA